jgi:hypothetical protein
MTYKLIEYTNLSYPDKEDFFKFCYECSLEDQPAAKNMWEDDWYNKTYSLPYLLEIEKRFNSPNGAFFVLFDNSSIVGCSGVYKSSFNDSISIAGVRTWTSKMHRHASVNREYFFPAEKQWAIDHGYKAIALTFNDYNKNLIEIFKRKRFGETLDRINTREPKHLFYSNFNQVPFAVEIQKTPQWIIYETLTDFNFNWEEIRHR